MKTTKIIFILSLSVLCISINTVSAQGDLPSEQIEVVKDFDARLIDANKVSIHPGVIAVDTTERHYEYNVSSEVPPMEYLEPSLKPLALRSVKKPQVYRGFAKAGYGTPNFILGDAFYQLAQSDALQLGVGVNHSSANNKSIANQRYMDNDGRIVGTWYATPSLSVNGNMNYSLDDYYYYAEDPNEPNPDFNKRRYKTFNGQIGVSNFIPLSSGFDYDASVQFINHQDDQGVAENDIIANFSGHKLISGRHSIDVDLIADFTSLNDIEKRTLNNYSALPSFTFRADKFKIKGGVNVVYANSDFYFYPEFNASVEILEKKLSAFLNSTGGIYKNNFYQLSQYNPYLTTRLDQIQNTRSTVFSGGAKGDLSFLEYEAQVSYAIVRDQTLFLSDEDDARTFQPLYDDVNIWTAQATVSASPLPELETGLSISKMFYNTSTEEEAWHLPGFEGTLFAKYKMLDDRLRLRLDFITLSGIKYIRDDKSTDTLKAIYDVSVGADWFFTEKFGVFANVNNIAANKGQRWNRYPTFGFNAVGGLMVRF